MLEYLENNEIKLLPRHLAPKHVEIVCTDPFVSVQTTSFGLMSPSLVRFRDSFSENELRELVQCEREDSLATVTHVW